MLFFSRLTQAICVCWRIDHVFHTNLYMCISHSSSWEWPFPWHCSIRSTEAGRSMMLSEAISQGRSPDAYATDSGGQLLLLYLIFTTGQPINSPAYTFPSCIYFSHGLSLFHSFSPICSSAKETQGQRGTRGPTLGQNPPHKASDFLHLL